MIVNKADKAKTKLFPFIDFDKRKKVKNIIYTAMHRFAEDLKSEWNIEQNNNNKNFLINKLVADKTH